LVGNAWFALRIHINSDALRPREIVAIFKLPPPPLRAKPNDGLAGEIDDEPRSSRGAGQASSPAQGDK
jgi:hypothetical protein